MATRRRPSSDLRKSTPPPPPSPSNQRDSAIRELRKGNHLAELLRRQLQLIPELYCRDAALANLGDIATSLASSLSALQSEREQYCLSSSEAGAVVSFSDGGKVTHRHRRGSHGKELPVKMILTETPENGVFHWRKYGEKKILNADFPRLYYRCGNSTLEHKCPAKKYVQQQNKKHPPQFMVTFIHQHTCNKLFTADHQPSSSSISKVLDFAKASLASPVDPATVAVILKEEEDEIASSTESTTIMSANRPSYGAYDYDESSTRFPWDDGGW